jgi:hypothetical protein
MKVPIVDLTEYKYVSRILKRIERIKKEVMERVLWDKIWNPKYPLKEIFGREEQENYYLGEVLVNTEIVEK